MPVSRYRIIRPIPARLDYPGASFALELVKQRHESMPLDTWVFRARKLNAEPVCVLASALAFRSRLEQQLAEGIEVEDGTAAARIMARLVRDGIAEVARPGRG